MTSRVPEPELNEECPNSDDGTHCVHWWDGEECCRCGDGPMPYIDKVRQGMIEPAEN